MLTLCMLLEVKAWVWLPWTWAQKACIVPVETCCAHFVIIFCLTTRWQEALFVERMLKQQCSCISSMWRMILRWWHIRSLLNMSSARWGVLPNMGLKECECLKSCKAAAPQVVPLFPQVSFAVVCTQVGWYQCSPGKSCTFGWVYESMLLVAGHQVVCMLIEKRRCPGRAMHALQGQCFGKEKWMLHSISVV